MSVPLAPPGKALERMRVQARRRFVFASASLTLGSVLLAAAVGFLLARSEIGGLTGLILGALLQVLGLAAAAHAAVGLSRAVPLSEAAAASRRLLLASVALVLPLAFIGTLAWLSYVVMAFPVLLPAHPLFWGPVSAFAAVGLVFSARELASERMAIVAALGSGGVLGMALSAGRMSLAEPQGALLSPRLAWDLFLVAAAFLAIASAFERDPWAARSRRAA